MLKVHTVINEGSDQWQDPASTWETDGWRNRGWFSPADARPLLKKGQSDILDAAMGVPLDRWPDVRWQVGRTSEGEAGSKPLAVLLVGADIESSGLFSTRLSPRALLGGEAFNLEYLQAGAAADEPRGTAGQEIALTAAALWEADAVVAAGDDAQYTAGLAAAAGKPVLVLRMRGAAKRKWDASIWADPRVTALDEATADDGESSDAYQDTVRSFLSAAQLRARPT
jgi:hypothetical protein